MSKKINFRLAIVSIILFVNLIVMLNFVSAADWYKGELHVYTGFRGDGYNDGIGCVNGYAEGYNISELKSRASSRGVEWQGYADETFCLESSGFNTVKTDCENAEDAGFTCLHGETLIVKDDYDSGLGEQYCIYCGTVRSLCEGIGGEPYSEIPPYRAGRIGAYGASDYISSGTGIEWCRNYLDPQDGIDDIQNYGGLAILHSPFGEDTAISRIWDFESRDYVSGYDGVEIWNADWDSNEDGDAKTWWKGKLLDGDKIYSFGGVGKHLGNSFDVYNFAYLTELNQSFLKDSLKEGYSSVSNNGEMYIEIYDSYNGTWENMGKTFNVCEDDIINISVTYDVDNACTLRIYKGVIGGGLEIYWEENISGSGSKEITNLLSDNVYFRSECISPNGEYRIYTNPIWVELAPDIDGDGYCTLSDCNDNHGGVYPGATEYCDSIDNDCDEVVDEGCEGGDPGEECTVTECIEVGYDQCFEADCTNCDVSIAVNYYENVNNIQWGAVNDASDPYVIGNYTVGWIDASARKMYYNIDDGISDCDAWGCDNGGVEDESTRATVYAPGIAISENIFGYDRDGNYACVLGVSSFSPGYEGNSNIYVLNCYDANDCSVGYFCDKTGSWSGWDCALEKGDGQSCTTSSQCSSGYCDNDGVGLNDSNICFTPYNTYFDGEDLKYCEYSTGWGDVDCDEKEIGDGCGTDCKWSINAPQESTMLHPNNSKTFETNTTITINWTLSIDSNNDFLRYFLQYSNDSGGNWTNIISNYGYENKLNDSSIEKELTFSGSEGKTVYIRLPKKSKVSYATMDITGF